MKNGQIETLAIPAKEISEQPIIKNKLRIYELIEDINGRFSSKRTQAFIYAFASIAYALFVKDANEVIVGIFTTAATGTVISGLWEKKQ